MLDPGALGVLAEEGAGDAGLEGSADDGGGPNLCLLLLFSISSGGSEGKMGMFLEPGGRPPFPLVIEDDPDGISIMDTGNLENNKTV